MRRSWKRPVPVAKRAASVPDTAARESVLEEHALDGQTEQTFSFTRKELKNATCIRKVDLDA